MNISKPELQIREMIYQAEKLDWEVVSLNIPEKYQEQIINTMLSSSGKRPEPGLKLQSLFGFAVYSGASLGMTVRTKLAPQKEES